MVYASTVGKSCENKVGRSRKNDILVLSVAAPDKSQFFFSLRRGLEVIILAPKTLDEKSVFGLVQRIWTCPDDDCQIDIAKMTYVRPFGALVLATELANRYERTGKSVRLFGLSEKIKAHSYLGHVGFFKAAYFEIGKAVGEAKGSSSYIPFRRISESELIKEQADLDDEFGISKPIQYFIENKAQSMSRIITCKSDEVTSIAYCIREVIRNVFEHGGASDCFVFGQKWDTRVVELGIADKGRGVLRSLQEKHNVTQDCEALRMCIEPGISGKDTSLTDEWSNSGFGLYVLSELGKRFGKFMLCSGSQGIVCSKGKCEIIDCSFHGTVLQLNLNLNRINNIATIIDDIIREGEAIAQSQGRVVKASQKSRIIW
ncbi:MAG: hypothetical protein E6713_12285 [Sporomusaceae bacterium]|nr:hypothetical protein [Sporomusaceae bacterium]